MSDLIFNDWVYIDDVVVTEEAQSIHCDTRSFHVFTTDENPEYGLLTFIDGIVKKPKVYENCIFKNWEDIKEYLKTLELVSGGKGNWRFLMFNYPKPSSKYLKGWHKYFRFVKVDDGWFGYTDQGSDYYVIRRDFVNEETMVKDEVTLNFIRNERKDSQTPRS